MSYCLIACLIGVPISYWLSGRYLESFSYHIQQHIWIYILPAIIIFAISLISVLWQTLRAARTNPAEALKKE
jgi:putative ABC transport system permease protein